MARPRDELPRKSLLMKLRKERAEMTAFLPQLTAVKEKLSAHFTKQENELNVKIEPREKKQ